MSSPSPPTALLRSYQSCVVEVEAAFHVLSLSLAAKQTLLLVRGQEGVGFR